MRIELDGLEMTDRQRTHDYLASQLGFPAYYGRNLDALYDLLTEGQEELEIRLCHVEEMKAQLGPYGVKLIQTLLDAANGQSSLTVTIGFEEK